MAGESNIIHCENGHVFTKRRYGTVCPYCNIETATKEKKEAGKTEIDVEEDLFKNTISPVCGFIVCIAGPRQGKDYPIIEGKNFVGRADDMDIQILGDPGISRRNHAIIVFDPKKQETVLLPGDANGIVYLEENAVYEPTPLKPYNIIELGRSRFVFIPFSTSDFIWGIHDQEPLDKPTQGETA